jgi:hypothetical protein
MKPLPIFFFLPPLAAAACWAASSFACNEAAAIEATSLRPESVAARIGGGEATGGEWACAADGVWW